MPYKTKTKKTRGAKRQKNRVYVGVGFVEGWNPGRGTKNTVLGANKTVQGGDDGGRSQGGNRRDPEQEKLRETQTAAIMTTHGGADGGRSHGGGRADDSRGPTDRGGAADEGRRAAMETRALRAVVEPQGRRAEAEFWTLRLEAEMETGRPAVNPLHRWETEGEQRGCQGTAVTRQTLT
ncbi:hypothetical protein H4Q32_030398 [Labeo rohita]|uniref:Uncharacterized protein n=1 Tax=Labeo rohita TaxID=84645 RepID=A0ABQ8L6N1_LABRO|nr:hypothetical protein H4Q32_030398 [Labeo rohita]